jgi:hypothetical protein
MQIEGVLSAQVIFLKAKFRSDHIAGETLRGKFLDHSLSVSQPLHQSWRSLCPGLAPSFHG